MFRSIVISANIKLGDRLVVALEETGHITISRKLDSYPEAVDLIRSVRTNAAEVLFVDFGSVEKALEIVTLIESQANTVQIVAFDEKMDPEVLRQSMRAGVRELLVEPFERKAILDSLAHIKTLLDRRPVVHEATNQLFSFLPSKAGVGTSTIAANVSAALARRPNTRVLLSDFDLSSGMLRFMLKLNNEFSVPDATQRSEELDENLWPQLVTTIQGLDVLHAGRINPNLRIDLAQLAHLTTFMRRTYQVLCFDLSGNLERYSIELMQESKRILLVCTSEIPSLHLAREKMLFLKDLGLSARVSIILNRMRKNSQFSKEQVEDMLGMPVTRVFTNDYVAVNRAVEEGKLLKADTELGKSFAEFAAQLMDEAGPKEESGKRKFLEFFRAAPAVATPRSN